MRLRGTPFVPVKVEPQLFRQVAWMRCKDRTAFYVLVKASGNTATTLAKKTGKSRQLISAIARGERNCSPGLAAEIVAAMNLPEDYIASLFALESSRIVIHPSSNTRPAKAA